MEELLRMWWEQLQQSYENRRMCINRASSINRDRVSHSNRTELIAGSIQTRRLLIVGRGWWRCTRLACYVCRQVFQQLIFLRFTSKAEIVYFALKLYKQVRQVIVELQLETTSIQLTVYFQQQLTL